MTLQVCDPRAPGPLCERDSFTYTFIFECHSCAICVSPELPYEGWLASLHELQEGMKVSNDTVTTGAEHWSI